MVFLIRADQNMGCHTMDIYCLRIGGEWIFNLLSILNIEWSRFDDVLHESSCWWDFSDDFNFIDNKKREGVPYASLYIRYDSIINPGVPE